MGNELTGSLAPTGAKMKAEVMADHVVFRGAIKAAVPFEDLVAEARGTLLILTYGSNVMSFGAGSRASQLAAQIRSPPSWMDRLGVPWGAKAAVAGPLDPSLKGELATRADVVVGPPRTPVDLLLFVIEGPAGLDALPKIAPLLSAGGALWVVHPAGLADEKLKAVGKTLGLAVMGRQPFPGGRQAVRLSRGGA